MALTDDQKAMLRLLAQREEGYEDIAALTGQSVDGVRAKVKEALASLDRPQAPADDQKAMLRLLAQREEGYDDIAALTGRSVEGVRAKVNEALVELEGPGTPPAKAPPPEPEPTPPPPPQPTPKTPTSASKPAAAGKPASRLKLPEDRGAVWGLGAGIVVVILVVLLATGALGGGGSNSGSSGSKPTTTTSEGAAKETTAKGTIGAQQPTGATLKPVNGGGANGQALLGRIKNKVVLQVVVKGLDPSPQGQSYVVWLYRSPKVVLEVGSAKVTSNGRIVGQFPIPSPIARAIAGGVFHRIDVTLASDSALRAGLAQAKRDKQLPPLTGTEILSGELVGPTIK